MKKLILSTLALMLALALCACGSDATKSTGHTSEQLPVETEPTTESLASEPTQEELNMLEGYADIYGLLSMNSSEYLAEYYETLLTYDADVLARWGNTEYAPSESFGDPINWDLNEVLGNFTVIENVLLEQSESSMDKLGNESNHIMKVSWKYDQNGRVCSIVDPSYIQSIIEEFPENPGYNLTIERDEEGTILKAVYGVNNWIDSIITYNYDQSGRLISTTKNNGTTTEECATYHYDTAGNLIRIECGDHVYNYTYNENGQPTKTECLFYINNNLYSRTLLELRYDANGILMNSTEKHETYDYSFLSGLNELKSYSIYEHQYTCDEGGNILKEEVQFGPTYHPDGTVKEEISMHDSYHTPMKPSILVRSVSSVW